VLRSGFGAWHEGVPGVFAVESAEDWALSRRKRMFEITNIWVSLLDAGTDVWRPVPAIKVSDDAYVLLRPNGYEQLEESWEFPPGSLVTGEERRLSGGNTLVAVALHPASTFPEGARWGFPE
jgi:hypothetical protein